ncbi:CatA-like O-acetyltransferase [Clostridium gasigenes]|uniref:CatA-like O-acetyltransferase n=1 Tax=Clostridium gasigenes TaxID=94869 RepID=UPI001C0CF6B9|nr:hypothetical protein [Clostridium gasigenes]
MEKYERRENFEHYVYRNNCSYSLTANIDVTQLVEKIIQGSDVEKKRKYTNNKSC